MEAFLGPLIRTEAFAGTLLYIMSFDIALTLCSELLTQCLLALRLTSEHLCELEYKTSTNIGPCRNRTSLPNFSSSCQTWCWPGSGGRDSLGWGSTWAAWRSGRSPFCHLIRLNINHGNPLSANFAFQCFPFNRKSIEGAFTTVRCFVNSRNLLCCFAVKCLST